MSSSESLDSNKPRRGIYNDADMRQFMESSTKKELLNFVEAMGKACAASSSSYYDFDALFPLLPPPMAVLVGALQQLTKWVDDFPPISENVRFGNPSFRQWHTRLLERSSAIVTTILKARRDNSIHLSNEEALQQGRDAAAGRLTPDSDSSIDQVSCYLHDAFGHAVRLDYGTGHESSFFVFLLVLSKVKCFGDDDVSLETLRAITLTVTHHYLQVTRRVQTDYRLEPAGSHGVWGLDDYYCVVFYLGACQLQGSGVPLELQNPKCQNDPHTLQDYGDQYLYLGCIRYILFLKQGVPFFESSPMLYDISQTLQSWDKVARGLLRLYQGEVLDKRVVVQHFVFSKLFPCTWTPSRSEERVAPTDTFRKYYGSSGMPATTTRAPWATNNNHAATTMPAVTTRAPWAANNNDTASVMPATKAPWATTPNNDDDDGADTIETKAPWAIDK